MTRSPLRSLILTAPAAATLLCVATPAFAQESPPPVAAAAAIPPPMQAMAAPKGMEDMTGSLGFGVGVQAGMTTLVSPVDVVAVKYWLSDVLAVVPSLSFQILKPNPPGGMAPATDTRWNFTPSAILLFVPFRSTSTRFSVGGGLGFGLGKTPPATNTSVRIYVPIQAGVEHFFTRWFSMGIAARANLISYSKDNEFSSAITTIQSENNSGNGLNAAAVGQLFFYTD